MELHVTKRKGREIVVLLDNDMRIVKPVYDYLKYQDQRDRAMNTIIAYGNDLKAFWEFLSDFHGKTEDEIDDVITDLAKTMSFNPLPTGVCLYDFRRGNCTDGDGCFFYNCPNYITEVQFYPILKDELDLLEKEMARLKELGQEPAYQVQAVKYKYLKPLVESLEVQLNGKESVG